MDRSENSKGFFTDHEMHHVISKESFGIFALQQRSMHHVIVTDHVSRKRVEWDFSAQWTKENNLNHPSNRWVIQVPRIYHILKANGDITNFQDMLDSI